MDHDDDLFRQTFRDSPIGIAVMDARGVLVELNPTFARILGHDAAALVGSDHRELTHPDDAGRDAELMDQLRSGDLPYFQVQKRFLHRSGDVVWTRTTVSAVPRPRPDSPQRFVVQLEDVTEIRRAKDLLERRALYDHLTGLANRTLLLEKLAHALDGHDHRAATVACIFLDVDHFKVINDSLGHEGGDTLLVELAGRLQGAVRPGDTVARLGGDEFVVVLENVLTEAAAEGLLAVITAALQAPATVDGHEVAPTVSAGLAFAEPGITAESLVRNADLAMYSAKKAGRARTEVFNAGLRESAVTRLSIESELRSAIREGDLVVHYQPVVDLVTREVRAFEALVRWQHPQRGLLMPDEFMEVCEEANLVVPLGSRVLHEACRFMAERPTFDGRVFVNVSTRQIGAADLTRVVRSALAASGLRPDRLGLEITETGMLMAAQGAHADLAGLVDLGVDLIVDDFGTGYSALSSVLTNPVAGLKLAREFTLRLGDQSTGDRISTAMATLTRSLGMYGVIEGVETEAQHVVARRHGWTYGQGFLFGHPAPAAAISVDGDGVVSIRMDGTGAVPSPS